MFADHYPPLVVAYLIALGGWLAASRVLPSAWPAAQPIAFEQPWKEFALALLGAGGIIAFGQLWTRGVRLPERGAIGRAQGRHVRFSYFVISRANWRESPTMTSSWSVGGKCAAVTGAFGANIPASLNR